MRRRRYLLGRQRGASRPARGARLRREARDRDDDAVATARAQSRLRRRQLEGERWITDASILTGEPIRIPAPGEARETGPLPRFEWLDGKPAVIWRTLRVARRLPVPHRADRRRRRRMGRLHRQSGVWSPFNYELSARLMRGPRRSGVSPGERFAIEGRRLDLRLPARSRRAPSASSSRSSASPRRSRAASRTTAPHRPVPRARFRMSMCGRGARSEREWIPARRSGWNLFESRDPFPRKPLGSLGCLSGPRVAAGLAVGRPPARQTETPAPDRQAAGDSRPPNATLILKRALSRRTRETTRSRGLA